MMRILCGIVIVFSLLSFYSCDTEELKVPTQFGVYFNLDQGEGNNDGKFNVSKADIFLKSFELIGNREVGNNIYINEDFNKAIQIKLLDNKTVDSLEYEVPQGVYNNIKLRFRLTNTNDTAIIMKGVYNQIPANNNGNERDESDKVIGRGKYDVKDKIHVLLRIGSEIKVEINAKPAKKDQIVLTKEKKAECAVNLDLNFIQSVLNPGKMKDAETVIIDGRKTVVISQDKNRELHRRIVQKIEQSFEARISS